MTFLLENVSVDTDGDGVIADGGNKPVAIWATNEENHPTDYDPVGYYFSLIFKLDQPIDFSGGFVMTTDDIGSVDDYREWFLSLNNKDNGGMPLLYRVQKQTEEENKIDYNTKNQ